MEAQKVFDELRLIGFRWGEIIDAIGSPEPVLIKRNDSRLRDGVFNQCKDRLPVTYDGTR